MRIKKLFIIGMLIIFILSIVTIIYAKKNIKHVNYSSYINGSLYSGIDKDEYLNMFDLGNDSIGKDIDSINELEKIADYILIVNNSTPPTFRGNGIINNCIVKKVIKGDNIEEKSNIRIYDLLVSWKPYASIYLGGSTPLKIGDDYIIFVNKTSQANMKNTYVFAHEKYGHLSLSRDTQVLDKYQPNTLTIEKVYNYDYVFSNNSTDEQVDSFENMSQQIKKHYVTNKILE